MQIYFNTSPNFGRALKSSEEADYTDTLSRAKIKAAGGRGKNVLIVPSSSLPQTAQNDTGVGNIASKEGLKFIDFAKKYWGINEVQLLPVGQYSQAASGSFPIYSSTSMELGNHLIDIKSFLPENDYEKLVKNNMHNKRVNFSNIVPLNSNFEGMLWNLHKNIPENLKTEFLIYKNNNLQNLERSGIYNALLKHYYTSDVAKWADIDRDLYDDRIVSAAERGKRIAEIYKNFGEEIDFYYFKQFLAEKSLKKAKAELNSKGIKLNSDMIFGFSYSEKWANPKAFIPNTENPWGAPMLDFDSQEGIDLLRKKVRFNAERFDGIRVDASWMYVSPKYRNIQTGETFRKDYGDRILSVIDEEVKKVKGQNYDLKSITHEFIANEHDFSAYSKGVLKPFVSERTKLYTSEYLSGDWGSADAFIKRGWSPDRFIVGNMNQDSAAMEVTSQQKSILSRILKIPEEKLADKKEFVKAKFAEPLRAKNNFLFFMPALGIDGRFDNLPNDAENYTVKIPENYEKFYTEALARGEGYNPMDALEKQFKAQGLDKTDKKLFRKIQKYRKILEQKENAKTYPWIKITAGAGLAFAALYCIYKYFTDKNS